MVTMIINLYTNVYLNCQSIGMNKHDDGCQFSKF
jgi:hypothetical protein